MVTGKQHLLLGQRKGKVVRAVARCEHAFKRPARPLDHVAMIDCHVRLELVVARRIQRDVA
jgi:hypothetical protein